MIKNKDVFTIERRYVKNNEATVLYQWEIEVQRFETLWSRCEHNFDIYFVICFLYGSCLVFMFNLIHRRKYLDMISNSHAICILQ